MGTQAAFTWIVSNLHDLLKMNKINGIYDRANRSAKYRQKEIKRPSYKTPSCHLRADSYVIP